MKKWEKPGDFLYAEASTSEQPMIDIKDDHDYPRCPCSDNDDSWMEYSDAVMRWSPGATPRTCDWCQNEHGAECPKIGQHMLWVISFAGTEESGGEFIGGRSEPSEPVPEPPQPARPPAGPSSASWIEP